MGSLFPEPGLGILELPILRPRKWEQSAWESGVLDAFPEPPVSLGKSLPLSGYQLPHL